VTEQPQPIPVSPPRPALSGSSATASATAGVERPRWSRQRPAQAAAIYSLCYLATGLIGNWLAARTTSDFALWLIVLAVGVLSLAFALLLALSVCRIDVRPGAEAAWMVGAVVVFALARPLVLAVLGRWLGLGELGGRLMRVLPDLPGQQLVGNIALILWAIFLGRLVSHVIREGKMLLPVAVVASIADVITVFHGVVAKVTAQAPEVLQAFSATAPVAPPPGVTVPVLTAVGIGDFLFLALFLTIALRYSMNAVQAMWGAFAAMLVAPFAFFIWPDAPGMPGLPFISVGVLAANWKHLQYSASERRALVIAGAVAAALTAAVWVVVRR